MDTNKPQKLSLKKRKMIKALEGTYGVVTQAALQAKINRRTHYAWLEEDPLYKEAVDELQNVALDFVESKLHKNIEEGKEASCIFYLKTKGQERGYIEQSKVDLTTGGDKLPSSINIHIAPVAPGEELPADEDQVIV